ncbi:hypothetical protein BCR43DRAFT_493140 [Syncephalastrum racemosum]|uniref:VPS9 domain-containing protein n=1 Tax=Syncephalastrum racemosum TaxID=13706 RepID=A0A1X2HA40_SYNRA|nr:hypothetical protein BCR43DRAFT_493140 [Syncephalastrum racemosum]
MDKDQQQKKNDSQDDQDPDSLVDEFDEKAALHSTHDEDDNTTKLYAKQSDDLDEKAALHQEHQNELDDLLDNSPPSSRQEQEGQPQGEIKPTDQELQHIFDQFDGKNDKDSPDEQQKRQEETQDVQGGQQEPSPTEPGSETTTATTTTDGGHARQSSISSDSTHRPSLAEIRRTADETKGRERQEVPFDFNRFLEQMRRKSAIPITRYFKSFLQRFDRRPWTVSEQIKIIQDFLEFIYERMRECDVWRDASEQEFENAKEGMEKLVMNRLYHATFSPGTTDDKERDEILYQKISIFRWIREEHLDIPKTQHNESFLTFAEAELLKINNYKAPRDKLICILNCCKVIFGLIKHVEGDAGADKFLPILIYVILRANPPRLISNVQYISRFRNPDHLQSESGYYLTNLMGSITFIESMEASSLSISKEEFDANIERTMAELEQERPSIALDKQKINYDNAVHPSRSPRAQPQPLIDPVKAAALLERGSSFAQKTMQKPLNFVGKIFQGLNESSDGEDDDDEERPYRRYVSPPQQQQHQHQHQHQHQQQPPLMPPGTVLPDGRIVVEGGSVPQMPPRPLPPDPRAVEAQRVFDANLQTIITMFPNVEPDVCFMVFQANEGHVSQTVDTLLEISEPSAKKTAADSEGDFPDTAEAMRQFEEQERHHRQQQQQQQQQQHTANESQ